MNYSTPSIDNQLNNGILAPEIPFLTQIPKTLRPYPNWVSWAYHQSSCGDLIRVPTSEPGALDETLKRCNDEALGLGFLLTLNDPITVICIKDYLDAGGKIHPDAQDVVKLASTYTEIDDNLSELYVLGYAEGLWNVGTERIGIYSDRFIVPITGHTLGVFPDVVERSQEFATVSGRYCAISWLERFEELRGDGDDVYALGRVLTECLSTPNWRQDGDNTNLWEFLYLCWDYPRLKAKVYDQIEGEIRDFKVRSRIIDSIEAIIEQIRDERASAKPKLGGKDDNPVEFDDNLPTIEHDEEDYARSVDDTMSALIASGVELWQRDGHIVSVRRVPIKSRGSEKQKMLSMRIVEAGKSHLLKLATSAAHHFTVKHGRNGRRLVKPSGCPARIIDMLQEEMELDFDPLLAISTLPTLRPDGSIISASGYDADTWLYYQPSREYPDPIDNPTINDAKAALEILKEPFIDFEFVREYHRSATIASILSIMARHLVSNAPLVTITANSRGTGKTLLFEVIAMIATGEEIPKSPFPTKDEEMEKQLLAHAIEGARIICFDNINGTFGSGPLDRVLTSQYVKGRILSKTENAQINMLTNFFATGNNLKYGDDTSRRSLPIAITSDMERPEERTGLTHPDLFRWVRNNQPQLAMAALTILQAYILAGMPKQDLPPFGSFQDWSDLVRSAVVWVGMDDPCEGRRVVEEESDIELDRLRTLINAWHLAYGSIGKEMKDVVHEVITHYNLEQKGQQGHRRDRAYGSDNDEQELYKQEMIDLGNALAAYDPKANDKITDLNHRRLSQKMPVDNGRSRAIGGRYLTFEADKRKGTKSYWIKEVKAKTPVSEYDDSEFANIHNSLEADDDLPF